METLVIPKGSILPDNESWTNRFRIYSNWSRTYYIVGQHKTGRYWGCSCPGYCTWKHCKHLDSLGLLTDNKPMEVKIKTEEELCSI